MTNYKQGSDSRRRLANRQRKKWANIDQLQPLFDKGIAEDSPVKYHKALGCSSTLTQEDGQITSTYCNKRFCAVCRARRTAILVDKHKPFLVNETQKGHTFKHITLTFQTGDGNNLKKEYNLLWEAWNRTRRSVKYHIRNGRLEHTVGENRLSAIVRAEINWRDTKNGKYHPHLHLIVKGNDRLAKFIKAQWCKFCRKLGKGASPSAQNTSEVYSSDALLEVFKYIHKPQDESGNPYPPEVIDNIWRTVKGRRTLRSYGGFRTDENKGLEEEVEEELEDYDPNVYAWKRTEENIVWDWDGSEDRTWYDTQTGEALLPPDGGQGLTSKDKGDKRGGPLREEAILRPYHGHNQKLSPDKNDPVFRSKMGRCWEVFKKKR